jgi:hypothetical protein
MTAPPDEPIPTTSDAEPDPPIEVGRNNHTGIASIMWGGVWVPAMEIEFVTEDGRLVEIVSFKSVKF